MRRILAHRIKTRTPRGNIPDTIEIITDRDQLEAVEHDAANFPGGKALALAKPQNEAGVAAILQRYAKILPVGAQSSVTGGATPNGEVVLSLARQDRILESGSEYIRAQAGLSLRTLGVITEATLQVVSPRPAICVALLPCLNEAQALTLTRSLREISLKTRQTRDQRRLDVSAIEYMDARSVEILREDGSDKRNSMLKDLYGESGLQQMLAVKNALDPGGKLAPGNLF